jgi:hypothetical protein
MEVDGVFRNLGNISLKDVGYSLVLLDVATIEWEKVEVSA